MTQTFVTTPLSTDELIRLKESLTPENRCELAYSGETVARLIETLSLQFLETGRLRDTIERAQEKAQDAGRHLDHEHFARASKLIGELQRQLKREVK